jgi:hypothetical protein
MMNVSSRTVAIIAMAGLVLLAAACGASSGASDARQRTPSHLGVSSSLYRAAENACPPAPGRH